MPGTGCLLRACCIFMLWLGLLPAQAFAAMEPIKPGQVPVLGPADGLVLIAVDTDVDVYRVRVNRDGKSWGDGVMSDLKTGQNYRLYVAPAGNYQWRELQLLYSLRYPLKEDPEFKFTVEAGKINYPGDLVFRPSSLWRADIRTANRGLAAIDWLQATHPILRANHRLAYSGLYPDPFPDFYRQALSSHPYFTAGTATPPGPSAQDSKTSENTFWQDSRILEASLNPAGTLLALHVRTAPKTWGVELIDLRNSTLTVLAESARKLSRMQWASDEMLLLSDDAPGAGNRVSVVKIEAADTDTPRYSHYELAREGYVIDPLPDQPGHILFGSISREGQLMVHRVDVSNQKAAEAFRPTTRSRLNQGIKDDVWWSADGAGNLRLATIKRDDGYVLLHGQAGEFREVMRLDEETGFDPVGISHDATRIYGLTEKERSQRDLVEFDVASGQLTRTLFSRPGVDVAAPILNSRREVIGVQFYQAGQLISEYFDADNARISEKLARAFPRRNVQVIDRSRDANSLILRVDDGDMPPQLFHLDVAGNTAAQIADYHPWLSGQSFSPTHTLKVRGPDGLQVEAFLTLPAGGGKRPLIVFPHGGPIGVADSLHFDNEVQFLAAQGYAVLRVNFRGSEGYGKAFREAGHRGYGTHIEDDIDLVLAHALKNHPVDEQRMCVVGSSYGGYSALVSAIRWPGRFRCVVSIAGVSDRILFFTASDAARNAKTRELMEKIMGDPKSDATAMQATSPVYQYEKLTTPVMLAHGREDARVDFEHSRRLSRLLVMAGRPAREMYFDKEGHGLTNVENRARLWKEIASFIADSFQAPKHTANPTSH